MDGLHYFLLFVWLWYLGLLACYFKLGMDLSVDLTTYYWDLGVIFVFLFFLFQMEELL